MLTSNSNLSNRINKPRQTFKSVGAYYLFSAIQILLSVRTIDDFSDKSITLFRVRFFLPREAVVQLSEYGTVCGHLPYVLEIPALKGGLILQLCIGDDFHVIVSGYCGVLGILQT